MAVFIVTPDLPGAERNAAGAGTTTRYHMEVAAGLPHQMNGPSGW
ncbi:MAG TPA: hypothetical protein VNV62_03340 [Trebonia sp.]|nr:hypothetical protein [Trebonia sp.]